MNELKNIRKKISRSFIIIISIIIFCIVAMLFLTKLDVIPKKYYSANDFGIKTVYSSVDFNNNNIDDYTDFLLGARESEKNNPTYISKYYENGYPPDNEGVCTDVIWRAFKKAGYSLRDMVDKDIELNPQDYPNIEYRDVNIDFRRVGNLRIFFNKYAMNLTLDYKNVDEWQPGDIVVFDGQKHIGIISDRRNKDGIPYVIHNMGQDEREEDYLTSGTISGHYRFDASNIDKDILIPWS